jgi:hypothetical protein
VIFNKRPHTDVVKGTTISKMKKKNQKMKGKLAFSPYLFLKIAIAAKISAMMTMTMAYSA